MRLLIVTAVEAEAEAIGDLPEASVVAGGIGRTNAAACTTESLLRQGPFDAVINLGVAGALPGGGLEIGQPVVASSCVYVEEGMIGPTGFTDVAGLGIPLGDFTGNAVPVDERLLETLAAAFPVGPIATVATCSGTDSAAEEVARRTGAVAEAMEGAAVVHAARRLGAGAIEVRVISNRTGCRDRQEWDLPGALEALGETAARVRGLLS